MSDLKRIEGRCYPLGLANVDTDLIIPAAYLKSVRREALGAHAFESVRQEPGNIFDDPRFAGAPLLLAGDNFGCGSSREHAAWAMADLGIRAIIAPGFSDIFAGNAFRNGIATVVLDQNAVNELLGIAHYHDVCVDLETMEVTSTAQHRFPFAMDPYRRECLLGGLDEIALTLRHEPAISAYEQRMGV